METKYIVVPGAFNINATPLAVQVKIIGKPAKHRGRDLITVSPVKGAGSRKTYRECLFDTAEEALASRKAVQQ